MIEKGPLRQRSLGSDCSVSTVSDYGDECEITPMVDAKVVDAPLNEKDMACQSDVHKYMAKREMTPLQERFNAVTVMPGAFYCFLFFER